MLTSGDGSPQLRRSQLLNADGSGSQLTSAAGLCRRHLAEDLFHRPRKKPLERLERLTFEMVPFDEEIGGVEAQIDFSIGGFPGHSFKRKIDRERRILVHQRCACSWITEYEKLCRPH
jgi:hypothetical protein